MAFEQIGKLSTGTVAPLWRELQLVEIQTVFPCRRRLTSALEWYDQAGNLVSSADIIPCP